MSEKETKDQVIAKILAKMQSPASQDAARKAFDATPRELGEAAVRMAASEAVIESYVSLGIIGALVEEPNFIGAGLFGRELCGSCSLKGAIGCFRIKDNHICLYCLPIVRRAFKGDLDALHNLTLAEVKAYIAKVLDKPVEADIMDINERA